MGFDKIDFYDKGQNNYYDFNLWFPLPPDNLLGKHDQLEDNRYNNIYPLPPMSIAVNNGKLVENMGNYDIRGNNLEL
jgi:hypothetical protein